MSDTLIAYILATVILAALALFVPCIDSVARLFRGRSERKVETATARTKAKIGRGEAA